jgi:hypothetical protein
MASTVRGVMCTGFDGGNKKTRGHFEDLGVRFEDNNRMDVKDVG